MDGAYLLKSELEANVEALTRETNFLRQMYEEVRGHKAAGKQGGWQLDIGKYLPPFGS